ncbi:MAG: CbtB-domain containing protein [Desulfobulbaceae bacterium]|nr:CbtB-domain containing protein [Gammaproteobacteria bacterium]MCP4339425.1 CbtB-domain containing protein [Desulfobulbaceae bacterium]
MQTHTATVSSPSVTLEQRVVPAVLAIMMGLSLIFSVGLVGSDTIHNAAHDVRHSMTFPCH